MGIQAEFADRLLHTSLGVVWAKPEFLWEGLPIINNWYVSCIKSQFSKLVEMMFASWNEIQIVYEYALGFQEQK